MTLFQWNNRYSLGIQEIDDQHKKWIDLINHTHQALLADEPQKELEDIFYSLLEYMSYHLDYEEKLLLKHGYPLLREHQNIHRRFNDSLLRFQQQYQAGDETFILSDMLNFLLDWLTEHIEEEDKKYADFLLSKGIQ